MRKQRKASKKRKMDPMRIICWLVIPVVMAGFLIADALGIYPFTRESMIVIGTCLAVVLLPFFGEIKIKDLSIKRSKCESAQDT